MGKKHREGGDLRMRKHRFGSVGEQRASMWVLERVC